MIEFAGISIPKLSWIELTALILVSAALWLSITNAQKRLSKTSPLTMGLVIALNLIVYLGLCGFILRPAIILDEPLKVRLNTTSEVLEQIDYPDFKLINEFDNKSLAVVATNKKVKIIQEPQQLLMTHPDVEQIVVIGDGLKESQWWGFDNIKIDYNIPLLNKGFINMEWNKSINLGETISISGEFQVPDDSRLSNKTFTLTLLDPAQDTVAKIQIEPHKRFKLGTQPKFSGKFRYLLVVTGNGLIDGSKNIDFTQSLHVNVTKNNQAKLLWIQSAPSFESKQLQNWAAEQGASILVKTTISREKNINRKTNFPDLINLEYSANFFHKFDLVIIDGRGFTQLSQQQYLWLEAEVNRGLGLLILADQTLIELQQQPNLLKSFKLEVLNENTEVNLSWLDNNNQWTKPVDHRLSLVAAKINLIANESVNSQVLVSTEQGMVVTQQTSFSGGRVALSLIRNSHQWVTTGNRIEHSQYWQSMIQHIARRSERSKIENVDVQTINFVNQMSKQCIFTDEYIKQLSLVFNGQRENKQIILLEMDTIFSGRHCGYFWPNNSGWQQLVVDKNTSNNQTKLSSWIYIEPDDQWLAHQQHQKIKATLAKQQAFYPNKFFHRRLPRPQSLWFFWWMVVFGTSLLWLERKLFVR